MYESFYTTKMSARQKLLEKRFSMIRKAGKAKKWALVLGVALAALAFSTSVMAGGLIRGGLERGFAAVEPGKSPALASFAQGGDLYLPLEQALAGLDTAPPESDAEQGGSFYLTIGSAMFSGPDGVKRELHNPPLQREGQVYVPAELAVAVQEESGRHKSIGVLVADQSGRLLASVSIPAQRDDRTLSDPFNVLNRFFEAFGRADYRAMKPYCTRDFWNRAYHGDGVIGIRRANITEAKTAVRADNKTPDKIEVAVRLEAADGSEFSGRTSASLSVALEKQKNGGYLVSGLQAAE